MRGRLKEEEFEVAFKEEKFDIPKAPALGLLLENVRLASCRRCGLQGVLFVCCRCISMATTPGFAIMVSVQDWNGKI